MLAITIQENESHELDDFNNNSVPMTDREVFQRVSQIRSGWSVAERVARRREAERRFSELMVVIGDVAAA